MAEILKPYVDFIFKRIFGSEETKHTVLLPFLNEVLKKTEPEPLSSLTLVNTHIDKEALTDKESRLDIRAHSEDGKQINLEIQVAAGTYDMFKRSLYYLTRMYGWQLKEKGKYKSLKKTIAINILKFNLLPSDDPFFHSIFQMQEIIRGKRGMDDLEVHFLELPKLEKTLHDSKDRRLVNWLTFIDGAPQKRWEELMMDTPGMEEATKHLQFLSLNEEERALYEIREKGIRDYLSDMEGYKEQGIKEGMEKGIEKGIEKGMEKGMEKGIEKAKLEVAKNLLAGSGMSISKIAEVTGLPLTEIEKLRKQ